RGFAVNLPGYRDAPRFGAVSSSPGDVPLVPPFGPLSGVRVLESARFVAGPWAATYLGEFGARVIHVEGPPFEPPYADPTRTLRPVLEGSMPGEAVSESWVQYSRNKLSVGLDIRRPEGRTIFLRLVEQSDIWIESYGRERTTSSASPMRKCGVRIPSLRSSMLRDTAAPVNRTGYGPPPTT